jgi:hypothetical protein
MNEIHFPFKLSRGMIFANNFKLKTGAKGTHSSEHPEMDRDVTTCIPAVKWKTTKEV